MSDAEQGTEGRGAELLSEGLLEIVAVAHGRLIADIRAVLQESEERILAKHEDRMWAGIAEIDRIVRDTSGSVAEIRSGVGKVLEGIEEIKSRTGEFVVTINQNLANADNRTVQRNLELAGHIRDIGAKLDANAADVSHRLGGLQGTVVERIRGMEEKVTEELKIAETKNKLRMTEFSSRIARILTEDKQE